MQKNHQQWRYVNNKTFGIATDLNPPIRQYHLSAMQISQQNLSQIIAEIQKNEHQRKDNDDSILHILFCRCAVTQGIISSHLEEQKCWQKSVGVILCAWICLIISWEAKGAKISAKVNGRPSKHWACVQITLTSHQYDRQLRLQIPLKRPLAKTIQTRPRQQPNILQRVHISLQIISPPTPNPIIMYPVNQKDENDITIDGAKLFVSMEYEVESVYQLYYQAVLKRLELQVQNNIAGLEMEEKIFLADQKLEAMINRLRKDAPQIKCPSGNTITKLCTHAKCKSALRCGNKECKDCGKTIHKACGFIPLEQFTDIINERTQGCRQFLIKIFEIEQEFINNIRKSQKQFIDKYGFGHVDAQTQKILNEIYDSGVFKVISGKEISDICEHMQIETEDLNTTNKEMLKKYSQKISSFMEEFQLLRIKCLSSSPIQLNFESKILALKGNQDKDLQYIYSVLGNPKKIQLIFRGSEHAFNAGKFHQKCDNIEDTLVLVRTQAGKTVGGFTHYKWNKQQGQVSDKQRRAFLIQLDLYEKMVPVTDTNLIYCRADLGPWFGSGNPDLGFYDNERAYAKFPSVYNKEGPNKYTESQNSYTTITGDTSGYIFKITQYEVFHVVFN